MQRQDYIAWPGLQLFRHIQSGSERARQWDHTVDSDANNTQPVISFTGAGK